MGAGAGAAKGGGKGRAGPESVFCYVNSCFAPGGDEVVGNLWRVSEFLMWDCCAFWGGKGRAVGGAEGWGW